MIDGRRIWIGCFPFPLPFKPIEGANRKRQQAGGDMCCSAAARCGAQELVMQQRGKCGVTHRAQVRRRSLRMLAEGGALLRRMARLGPTNGAVASYCNAPAAIFPARAPRRRLVNAINPPDRPRTGICVPQDRSRIGLTEQSPDWYWRRTSFQKDNGVASLGGPAHRQNRVLCSSMYPADRNSG